MADKTQRLLPAGGERDFVVQPAAADAPAGPGHRWLARRRIAVRHSIQVPLLVEKGQRAVVGREVDFGAVAIGA